MQALLLGKQPSYNPEKRDLFRTFTSHRCFLQILSFPTGNKLAFGLRNSVSVSLLKKELLVFIRPKDRSIYNSFDPVGLKLLTRLRIKLSHLREHKFRHNCLDTLNPLCSSSLEIESTIHYLLRCPFFTPIKKTLLDNIINIIGSITDLSDDKLVDILLYGDDAYNTNINSSIIKCTITFLKSSERFDIPLL